MTDKLDIEHELPPGDTPLELPQAHDWHKPYHGLLIMYILLAIGIGFIPYTIMLDSMFSYASPPSAIPPPKVEKEYMAEPNYPSPTTIEYNFGVQPSPTSPLLPKVTKPATL